MELFGSLAVVLGTAAVFGVVARMLRQPVLLGYIAAGVALAALGWGKAEESKKILELMGQLGVTLLLFLVGLELPLAELKKMGRVALATGLGQIIFTSVIGYVIIRALGFGNVPALYLAIALTFSSTIVIVKLLSEKKDLQSLYGKIAVGFLLVQDFVAIGILVVMSGLASGGTGWGNLAGVMVKGIILVAAAVWLAGRVMPKLLDWLGRSTELLFVGTIAWCLAVAAVVASPWVGFSIEIGGFLAGLALAATAEHWQILARTRPLRDFFLTLFFVVLGASVTVGQVRPILWPAAALSAFVLVGNLLIVMAIMGVMGYKKRTSFMAGITVAQISEFSLILVALAVKTRAVGPEILSLTALVGAVTMTISTYLIMYSESLYKFLKPVLGIFERRVKTAAIGGEAKLAGHILLLGHNRMGSVLRPALEKLGRPVVVVDFDPRVVEETGGVYGDIADYELYDQLNLDQAEMVLSTVSDVEDNLQLLSALKKKRPISIILAADAADAVRLYKAGADLVLVPHTIGGEYLSHLITSHGLDKKYLQEKGRELRERLIL